MAIPEGNLKFYARNRREWRNWLKKNYAKEKKVWLLIYHKGSETPSVYYNDAVEEALCFGWIDSRPNKNDGESFYLSFSPRKPKSVWSKLNKDRVKKLIVEGKMHTSGLRVIAQAKETGMWDALAKIDNLEMPDDLLKAFRKNKAAFDNYKKFPPSSKKIILGWIQSAKRNETRQKRIQETIVRAQENVRANHYKQK